MQEDPDIEEPLITDNDNELVFHKTALPALINEAITEQKVIMLFFSADWCKPCKEYKEVTFQEKDTKSYLQKYFMIKYLDVETDFEGLELKPKYEVNNLPTLVFLSPEGNEIHRVVGHIAGYSFLKKLREIKALD